MRRTKPPRPGLARKVPKRTLVEIKREQLAVQTKDPQVLFKQTQNSLINTLLKKRNSLNLLMSDTQRNLRAAKTPSGKANQLAAIRNIRRQQQVLANILNRVKGGILYTTESVLNYISVSGDIAGEKAYLIELPRQKRKVLEEQQETQKVQVKKKVEQDVKEIQKQLKVSKPEAQQIRRQINKDKGFGVDMITKADKPKEWSSRLAIWKDKVFYDIDKLPRDKIGARLVRKTFVLGGIGILSGLNDVKDMVLHPVKTAKSYAYAITHPRETIKTMVGEFEVDPVGTVLRYFVFTKTLKLGSKAVKRSPVGQFVIKEGFIRVQPKEIRTAVRKILDASDVQKAINPYNVKKIRKVDFMEIKSLTRSEAKALAKTLAETDSVIFGSAASRTLSLKQTPIPKDIDIATRSISVFNKRFVNNLPRQIQKGYAISKNKLIRLKDNSALMDIKTLQRLYPDRTMFSRRGWIPISGYVYDLTGKLKRSLGLKSKPKIKVTELEFPTQKTVQIGKIKMIGFGEQNLRKAQGSLRVLIEQSSRRAKDPQAFVKGIQVQLKSLRAQKPKNPIAKISLNYKINKLSSALDYLTSKAFKDLLRKKVPRTKLYPIIEKKLKFKQELKKIKEAPSPKPSKRIVNRAKKVAKDIGKETVVKAKRKFSKIPQKYRRLVYSYLPKKIKPKLSSLLPPRRVSSIIVPKPSTSVPSRIPFRPPSIPPSKVPSRIPSRPPSKPPSRVPSKVPSRIPSRPPSKPPSIPPSKIPVRPPPVPPKKIIIPRIRVHWKTKLPKGYSKIVNILVRIKGRVREIQLKTTTWRAIRYIVKYIDNKLARSFDVKIIGVARIKDVSPISLNKFRFKAKASPVLKFVEKTKYAIDTPGEKKGLRLARRLKK